ncbi:DUF2958 domain-containing protein [Nocardioides sp. BGMRC 2183]|nr:DUF2958 domain-containing protein [Nocardioides sp. BGMRC 2183]
MSATEADRLRGHEFLPDADVLAAVPSLYETESVPAAEKVIHLHYFVGSCDWWVAELDEDARIAFGFASLSASGAEWGYVDLHELRAVVARPHGYPVVVERDLGWAPTPFSQVGTLRA